MRTGSPATSATRYHRNVLVSCIFTFILSGCAATSNQITVSYKCSPPGAMISSGSNWVECPSSLNYTVTETAKRNGSITVAPLTAYWPSGAQTKTPSIRVDLAKGLNQSYTIQRPNVPGIERDIEAARVFIDKQRIEGERAQARRDAEIGDAFNALAQGMRAANTPSPQIYSPVSSSPVQRTTCQSNPYWNNGAVECLTRTAPY